MPVLRCECDSLQCDLYIVLTNKEFKIHEDDYILHPLCQTPLIEKDIIKEETSNYRIVARLED